MTSEQDRSATPSGEVVDVGVPARSAYVSVLRTTAAALAARLDFTLDEIEDLRIAVDEACALILTRAASGSQLQCRFRLDGDKLAITVRTTASDGVTAPMPRDSFAWTVLSALADSVETPQDADGQVAVELVKAATTAKSDKSVQ